MGKAVATVKKAVKKAPVKKALKKAATKKAAVKKAVMKAAKKAVKKVTKKAAVKKAAKKSKKAFLYATALSQGDEKVQRVVAKLSLTLARTLDKKEKACWLRLLEL